VYHTNDGVSGADASRELLPTEWLFESGSAAMWRELCSPFFEVSPINTERMQAPLSGRFWRIGPLVFWRTTCGGQILRRTVHQLSEFGEHVLISRYDSGRAIGSTERVPFQTRAGEVVIRDLSRPFSALQFPSIVESVLVPRHFICSDREELPTLSVFGPNELATSSLCRLFLETFRSLRASTMGVPSNIVERVLLTVREAILKPRYPANVRRASREAQLRAIQTYIEQNLSRLDLSAEDVLPRFGVSRATLYRMFEVYGGVRNYIVDRRLFHALLELSGQGTCRGKIQRAAKHWGFSSAANFNRSVQHVFGGAPGALFRAPPASEASEHDVARHRFQRELPNSMELLKG
jgi:AraC-like DNA-binding protein